MAVELKLKTVCSWCLHLITEKGIRKSTTIEKHTMEQYSNGICLVCAIKYFK